MVKFKIFASDGFSKEGVEIFEKAGIFDVTIQTKTSREELLSVIDKYDALIIRSASKADKDVIEKGKKLKLIARAGVGLDNVDITAATERGIVVMNAPGGNTISAAELAFSLIMSLARKVPQANTSMHEKCWDKKSFGGIELNRKTLGVIGFGRIGREVAHRARAFNMNILVYDPFFPSSRAATLDIKVVDKIDVLLSESDFITIHTPLTKETENLITKKELSIMKKTAYLVNCARGGIIKENDLYEALKDKVIAGAALDVFEKEPPKEYIFADLQNCITTPHLGASTEEAQISVAIETADAMVSYFKDGVPFNSVNYPAVDKETLSAIQDYIALADKMGRMLGHIAQGEVQKFQVSYAGSIADKHTKMISLSVLKGFLTGRGASDAVNFVNAPLVAEQHGINLKEKTESAQGVYTDMVIVKIVAGDVVHELWGTVFEYNKSLRIVKYNTYHIEMVPDGIMLMLHYHDKIGFVGMIGSIIAENKINIADMSFVRKDEDGKTLMMLRLDSEMPQNVIDEIKKKEGIISVNYFAL